MNSILRAMDLGATRTTEIVHCVAIAITVVRRTVRDACNANM